MLGTPPFCTEVSTGILQEVFTPITFDLLLWYPNTFCMSPLLGYPSPPLYDPDDGGDESTASSWVSVIVHFVQHSTRPWRCSGLCHPDCLSNFRKGRLFGVELGKGCGWCNELSAGGQLFLPTTITVSVTEVLVDFLFWACQGPTPNPKGSAIKVVHFWALSAPSPVPLSGMEGD